MLPLAVYATLTRLALFLIIRHQVLGPNVTDTIDLTPLRQLVLQKSSGSPARPHVYSRGLKWRVSPLKRGVFVVLK